MFWFRQKIFQNQGPQGHRGKDRRTQRFIFRGRLEGLEQTKVPFEQGLSSHLTSVRMEDDLKRCKSNVVCINITENSTGFWLRVFFLQNHRNESKPVSKNFDEFENDFLVLKIDENEWRLLVYYSVKGDVSHCFNTSIILVCRWRWYQALRCRSWTQETSHPAGTENAVRQNHLRPQELRAKWRDQNLRCKYGQIPRIVSINFLSRSIFFGLICGWFLTMCAILWDFCRDLFRHAEM